MKITKNSFMNLIAEAMSMSMVDLYKKPSEFREAFSLYIEEMLGIKPGEVIDSTHKSYSFIVAIIKAAEEKDERRLSKMIRLVNKDADEGLMNPERRIAAINRHVSRKSRFFAAIPLKSSGRDFRGKPAYEYTG